MLVYIDVQLSVRHNCILFRCFIPFWLESENDYVCPIAEHATLRQTPVWASAVTIVMLQVATAAMKPVSHKEFCFTCSDKHSTYSFCICKHKFEDDSD